MFGKGVPRVPALMNATKQRDQQQRQPDAETWIARQRKARGSGVSSRAGHLKPLPLICRHGVSPRP